MGQITCYCNGDTGMRKSVPTSHYDACVVGEANTAVGNLWRSLFKFDLSQVPDGANITGATMKVYVGADYASAAGTIEVYRVKRNWVEAQVTWNNYATGSAWGTAGCANTSSDREATTIGSLNTSAYESGWLEITLDADAIQEWLDGEFDNYGVLLKTTNELNDAYAYETTADSNPSILVLDYDGVLVEVCTTSEENDMRKASPTNNRAAAADRIIGETNTGANNVYRTMMTFNLSNIPSGIIVDSAKLRMRINTDYASAAGTIEVYRILRDWVDSESSWANYKTGSTWTTGGCGGSGTDRESTNIGTKATGAGESVGSWIEIDLDADAVQQWINGGFENNGMLLKTEDEADDAYQYDSSNAQYFPTLTVAYRMPNLQAIII